MKFSGRLREQAEAVNVVGFGQRLVFKQRRQLITHDRWLRQWRRDELFRTDRREKWHRFTDSLEPAHAKRTSTGQNIDKRFDSSRLSFTVLTARCQ
jgi:hypothetical protein